MSHPADPSIDQEFLLSEQKKYFTFMNLAFLMTALTGIELVIIFLPFPGSVLIFGSLVFLSLIKFVGVIFWFMHLIYDGKLLTVIFLFGMALAAGTSAALLLIFSEDRIDKSLPFYEDGKIAHEEGASGH
ncbi:cytochrome C oxidase subunit IV family protein [Puniceicoccus vermicola]|uniref:Cytochrome C oxidase subunit IV family protein n=1 Tax=Puniceicoccus vermicola TaxID=388746 RepID=A0A7X1E4P5_9BACT|nr:cytochrome C oxidase subunit IV family protein [Puniceicoccus vermicola]MBC2600832.1 cytochrome C oxidase subunit IV family protein [Puniceicoccus vermicola]